MAWKVMDELAEMMEDEKHQEEISNKLLQKSIQERNIRLILTDRIYTYLRKEKKSIGEVGQKDLDKISEGFPERYQGMLMEQFMKALKTQRGKPIKRIKQNNKSILLNQLD